IPHDRRAGADLHDVRDPAQQRRHGDPAGHRQLRRGQAPGEPARVVQGSDDRGDLAAGRFLPAPARLSPRHDPRAGDRRRRLHADAALPRLPHHRAAVHLHRGFVRVDQGRGLLVDRIADQQQGRARPADQHHRRPVHGRRAGRWLDLQRLHRSRRAGQSVMAERLLAAGRDVRAGDRAAGRLADGRIRGAHREDQFDARLAAGNAAAVPASAGLCVPDLGVPVRADRTELRYLVAHVQQRGAEAAQRDERAGGQHPRRHHRDRPPAGRPGVAAGAVVRIAEHLRDRHGGAGAGDPATGRECGRPGQCRLVQRAGRRVPDSADRPADGADLSGDQLGGAEFAAQARARGDDRTDRDLLRTRRHAGFAHHRHRVLALRRHPRVLLLAGPDDPAADLAVPVQARDRSRGCAGPAQHRPCCQIGAHPNGARLATPGVRMKIRHALFAGLCLLATGASLPAFGQTDPSFLLTGTAANFGSYFPSYLANGYFSTMTSPRGTEPDMGYMVAFMDYAKGDIARPAAIPGWSEIDYNPGGGWLNATRLDPKIFAGYTQTLNMHDGTLSTGYRFDYANKSTDVQVTTFVSQADPHLAATRLTITPQFDGKVQLTFPFRLWSEHQPRFPIATMTGDEMINAVIASGQNLQNKPVPTPD